jgi:hypothetical protein
MIPAARRALVNPKLRSDLPGSRKSPERRENGGQRLDQNTRRRPKGKIHLPGAAGKRAFISAQVAGNEVVYSIVVIKARKPLRREDVERRFEGELSKK